MGEAYRATDTRLKREVAVKILPSALAADPDRLARFQREAEVLASLNHPHDAVQTARTAATQSSEGRQTAAAPHRRRPDRDRRDHGPPGSATRGRWGPGAWRTVLRMDGGSSLRGARRGRVVERGEGGVLVTRSDRRALCARPAVTRTHGARRSVALPDYLTGWSSHRILHVVLNWLDELKRVVPVK